MSKFYGKPGQLSPTAKSWEERLKSQDWSSSEQTNPNPTKKDDILVKVKNQNEYEEKMLLVSGLNERTTTDALWNYLKERTGIDVERVVFLGRGRAVVDLSSTLDFQNLVWTKLDGMQISVERLCACNSVMVNGFCPQVTRDDILSYFENVRCSGGGNVEDVEIYKETQCAVVIFGNSQIADRVASKRHFLNGNRLFVEKYFPQIDFQGPATDKSVYCTHKDELHKDIIMQFIMSGGYAHELKTKLNVLAARIQWSPTCDVKKIWEMADSAYLNQWACSYQAVVHGFLDQFEAFTIPVENGISRAVDEALPQLAEILPKEKALCKNDESKQELLVGCLKSQKENVSESVQKFLEIVKKEIYKKETITITSSERMLLLKKIGFVDKIMDQHSELEAALCEEKRELFMEGPCEEFTDAKNEYFSIMSEVIEETYALPYTNIGKVVKSEQGHKYLSEIMVQEKVSAIIFPQKGNAIRIVATNFNEFEEAKKCLRNSMKWFKVSFGSENSFAIEGKKWQELFMRLKEEQLLEICVEMSTSSVVLYGVSESVVDAKKEVENFIEVEGIQSESLEVPKGMVRFLKEQFFERVKVIEERLKYSRVSIKISQSSQSLFLKGTKEGLAKCKVHLFELYERIVTARKEFSSPGLAKLFYGDKGQRHLRFVETEKNVIIEVIETSAKHSKVVQNMVQDRQKEKAVMSQPNAVGSSVDCTSPSGYCNFSTKESLEVYLNFGNITNEKERMMPDFETAIHEKARENVATRASVTSESLTPDTTPQPVRFRSSNTRTEEIITLHFFAHSQQDINRSLDEVNKFVRDHIGTNTIEEEKICHLLMKHFSEVENLERVHDVCITCQPPSVVAVSGMKSSVDACIFELLSLINQHGGKELGLGQFWCTSDYAESAQFQQPTLQNEEVRVGILEKDEVFHCGENLVKCEWNTKNQKTGQVSKTTNRVGDQSAGYRIMLQQQDVEPLSLAISTKWVRLARLLNIPKDIVDEIRQDARSLNACSKAARVLEIFISTHGLDDATIINLIDCLHEIRVKLPECLLRVPNTFTGSVQEANCEFTSEAYASDGRLHSHQTYTLSGESYAEASSLDGPPKSSKNRLLTQDSMAVSDSTPLSQREIERLSREIASSWRQLANLLEIARADIENITTSVQCPNLTDKAVEVLQLYSDGPTFSRAALGEFLEELHLMGLKEKIVGGILRKRYHRAKKACICKKTLGFVLSLWCFIFVYIP